MGLSSNFCILFFKKCFLLYIFLFSSPLCLASQRHLPDSKWWCSHVVEEEGGGGCIRQAVWTVCPKMPPLPPPPIMKLYLSPSPPPPPPSTISHSLSPTQMAVSCPPLSLPLSDDAFPSASLSLAYLFNKPPSFTLKKKDTDRRESKDRCCYLGDVLECRTNQLAARMFWTKVFVTTCILVGWWFGVVWTGWSSIFSKHPHSAKLPFFLFILFFKITLLENI